MLRGFRRLVAIVAVLLGAGCGDGSSADAVCGVDADCPQGQLCSPSGTCDPDCSIDGGCKDAGALEAASDSSKPDVAGDAPRDVKVESSHDVGAEEEAGLGCTTDTDCDDSNPCSKDTCVSSTCEHAAVAGSHLGCQDHKCVAIDNTTKTCSDASDCAAAGDLCDVPAAGSCPASTCPFDAHDRFLDGKFPHFGLPYNDEWYYYSGETITNPDHPKFTSHSCDNDSKGGVTRSSIHVRALHKGTIDVTLTGMSTTQVNFIKQTLNHANGWVRAGLKFNFSTSFTSATDIQFKYCASCSVSVSGPQGSLTNPCGSGELLHRDSDYNVINFSGGSCFADLSSCSRWLINHEVGHALGLADRENAATEGKSIMNHTHYYGAVWPSDDLITMVVALRACKGKACLTP